MNAPSGDWDDAQASWSKIVLNERDCFEDGEVELAEKLSSQR
jgi:hypothetical protein